MRPVPNFEAFHKKIAVYLDVNPLNRNGRPVLFEQVRASAFFNELIYRTISKIISSSECSGMGDLSSSNLELTQDVNTYHVTFAGQQICHIREPAFYVYDLEKIIREKLKEAKDNYHKDIREQALIKITNAGQPISPYTDLTPIINKTLEEKEKLVKIDDYDNIYSDVLTMQVLQEGAALRLLENYMGAKPGEVSSRLLGKFYDFKSENDWKSLRCAFWRYLMYSGFAQVDKEPGLIKESIPREPLLPKLVDRFIKMYRLEEGYVQMDLASSTGKSVEEFLDPARHAESFLRFNGLK